MALAAILISVPRGPDAREPGRTASPGPAPIARAQPLLPPSSAMPLGDWRLPPPGYVDYCLRFKGRDRGCIA